jgi:aminopeptidase N
VFDSYRDQWIQEGLANYEALMYAESRKPQEHPMANWLERYRRDLTSKEPDKETTVDEAGPIILGHRLRSSKDPGGYERVVYEKGSWIFHMLRMMLRDPMAKNPDERFGRMLRTLLETHRYRAVTTDDLQHAVEAVMTPQMALEGGRSMDWFFDQWVRGTGIPHYTVEFTAKPLAQGTGFTVRGTLKQSGVADSFLANVPLYVSHSGGKPTLLGTVIANGPETAFHFTAQVAPKKIVVDAQQTLLCIP